MYCTSCFSKLGKHPEAIDDCTKAIQLDRSYQKAFLRRARAFTETEEFDQVIVPYPATMHRK